MSLTSSRNPPPVRRRLPLAAVAALTLSTATLTASPVTAHAAPEPEASHTASATAKEHGIDRFGEATLGWSAREGAGVQRSAAAPQRTAATTLGLDVSNHNGTVPWSTRYAAGHRFVWIKATEGTSYTSPSFSAQYRGSESAGFLRGAYHFANPSGASGAAQADYFVDHGGGWSGDGKTLPGVLDLEYNPYAGGACYGRTSAQNIAWTRDFLSRYRARTGRDAVIYTSTSWWKLCMANTSAFSAHPLWLARYSTSVGELPAGWGTHTVWQFTDSPYDQNRFNGGLDRVKALAGGGGSTTPPATDPWATFWNGVVTGFTNFQTKWDSFWNSLFRGQWTWPW